MKSLIINTLIPIIAELVIIVSLILASGCAHVAPTSPYTCTTDTECYNECITLHQQKDCE